MESKDRTQNVATQNPEELVSEMLRAADTIERITVHLDKLADNPKELAENENDASNILRGSADYIRTIGALLVCLSETNKRNQECLQVMQEMFSDLVSKASGELS